MIKQYDRVKLKSGKSAVIVEVYEQGVAYEADIELGDDDYATETIKHADIAYVVDEDKGALAV